MACVLFAMPSVAKQDSVNLFHKRSIGYSTGFMGIHSFLAPTFEMKTAPLNYRFRIGYYSVAAGLELETGSIQDEFVNRVLGSKYVHYVLSLSATYRWDNSWWNFTRFTRPVVKSGYNAMLLWGIKAYPTKTIAVSLKGGAMGLTEIRSVQDGWTDIIVDRQQSAIIPYMEVSLCSYFWRIRKD